MLITIQNRRSAKSGNMYQAMIAHIGDREKFISFDPELLAVLTDGMSFVDKETPIIASFDLTNHKEFN